MRSSGSRSFAYMQRWRFGCGMAFVKGILTKACILFFFLSLEIDGAKQRSCCAQNACRPRPYLFTCRRQSRISASFMVRALPLINVHIAHPMSRHKPRRNLHQLRSSPPCGRYRTLHSSTARRLLR